MSSKVDNESFKRLDLDLDALFIEVVIHLSKEVIEILMGNYGFLEDEYCYTHPKFY